MNRTLLALTLFLVPGCPGPEMPADTGEALDAPEPMDTPNRDAPDAEADADPDASDVPIDLDAPIDLDVPIDLDTPIVPDVPMVPDAPPFDAGVDAPLDAGTDAGPPDAGPPDAGPPDAGPPTDRDRDGLLSNVDCNDDNAAIGRNHIEACTSSCAAGTRLCTDGTWFPCTASTDCACSSPGMVRTTPCGRCGTASQTCQASGTWSMPGTCFGEGECFAGYVERDLSLCGDRERLCDATCAWGSWVVHTPAGVCEPGAVERTFSGCTTGTRTRTCLASCGWGSYGTCEASASTCVRAPAASRSGADPVCIPAGPFLLGRSATFVTRDWSPERRVYLSEYYIDRYPVTRSRVDACVAAGGCAAPTSALYATLEADHLAIGLSWADADAFCRWDGGSLATEFQYEKAGRGAEPDRRYESWGGTTANCTHVPRGPGSACPDYRMRALATEYPAAVSPFGVRFVGSLTEFTSTLWHSYDSMPPDSVDPAPAPASMGHVIRGVRWTTTTTSPSALQFRREVTTATEIGFRCVY